CRQALCSTFISYTTLFRSRLLIEMQDHRNVIISCGGGVALRERNVKEMKKNGRVVFLTASPETILERVKDDEDRPLLQGHKNVRSEEHTSELQSRFDLVCR